MKYINTIINLLKSYLLNLVDIVVSYLKVSFVDIKKRYMRSQHGISNRIESNFEPRWKQLFLFIIEFPNVKSFTDMQYKIYRSGG